MTEQNDTAPKQRMEDLVGGNVLANPLPGEEIVISGISGTFPNSKDVHEYGENLFNKVNMVSPNIRWEYKHPEIPPCSGTLPEITKYDTGFFGVHERQSQSLDAMSRMMHEKVIEAIFDAGLHPSDLENTKTGVFMGVCYSENDRTCFFENLVPESYAFTGAARSMIAHRISYFLKLKGPSHTTDTACSSSLYAFEHAYKAIRMGEIDNAIVGGTNLCLHPFVTLQFARLGVLSNDGSCKVFDKSGNGYARSETVATLILQKSKNAKRIYAQVIHAKTNCDGYKEQGITFPSGLAQMSLLNELYDECNVDRCSLSYLEAHGTGTSVGDPEEGVAIDLTLTKNRITPLLVGSVKSNIGHTEPASGICAIVKCIIAMETGFIPPNIHYSTPRDEIKGLIEGRMRVVVDKSPFEDNRGLIGINSFGFGGGNCHVLLRWNTREKVNNGIPEDNLPRLVCVSGRTEEAITCLLDEISQNVLDVEHLKLLHNVFRKNIQNNLYRGYILVSKTSEIHRSIKYSPELECGKPLSVLFKNLNDWHHIGFHLMELPAFANTIQRIQKCMSNNGVNILDSLLNKSLVISDDIELGSLAIHIGIMDILKLLEVRPINVFGDSLVELLCAYFHGNLTLEEIIDCSIIINKTISKVNNYGSKNCKVKIEEKIDFFTMVRGSKLLSEYEIHFYKRKQKDKVSGLAMVQGLSSCNMVNCDDDSNEVPADIMNIILQTNNSAKIKEHLLQSIKKVLRNLKHSTSKENFKTNIGLNALKNNYFGDYIPTTKSVILEIGNSQILDEDTSILSFPNPACKNYLPEFLKIIGSLYEYGYNSQIGKLYPEVEFPVSRGTRMISPYIRWKHSRDLFVPQYNLEVKRQAEQSTVKLNITDHHWAFIDGHVVDGKNLFPATGYIYLVWEAFSVLKGVPINEMNVEIENCKFVRATTISKKGFLSFTVGFQEGTGNFEIDESDSLVVTGRIHLIDDKNLQNEPYENASSAEFETLPLTTKDVYKELRLRGYHYKGKFRAIQKCDITASEGYIQWENNWVTFIDNMLQLKILQVDSRLLYVPTYIKKLTINARSHMKWIDERRTDAEKPLYLSVVNNKTTGVISCGGIRLSGLIVSSINRKRDTSVPVLENYTFIPNCTSLDIQQSVRVNMQIILENSLSYKVKAVELIDKFTKDKTAPLAPIIQSAIGDLPLIQPLVKILSKSPLDVSIEVEDKKLSTETDCLIIVASNILTRPEILKEASTSLKENGFIISREPYDYDNTSSNSYPDITFLTVHQTSCETLILLQKSVKLKNPKIIKISSSDNFSWVNTVQEAIKENFNQDVVLFSEKEPKSGIIGLVNCLRREPESKNIKCVFLADEQNEVNLKNVQNQLQKNMTINVYKNGQWGTYRHLLLNNISSVEREHCLANITVRGDLSSLRWVEGPLQHDTVPPPEKELVYVYYAALNFRDIMTASGRINSDVITQDRVDQECAQGFEFSGRDKSGNRIMGMMVHGALSTLILADPYLYYKIPDSWTMEQGASVPVVYATVLYAMIIRGQLKRNESVLIHSGTGGIGQAAIGLALFYGCKVYTTVGTKEKREYIKKTYPQIKDHQIGNSRDESFINMIYTETNGKGVDIVLNSLAEEKLLASVRCLARGGRFIELGKFDIANNKYLNLLLFQKEASFHSAMLDQIFNETPAIKKRTLRVFNEALESGAVKPLNTNIFKFNEVEQAFKFMATGKHIGKVLVKIREPEEERILVPPVQKFSCIPRHICDPNKTYVIVGGLGGFGLELADWLVLRGARKLVLTSRKGISTGYQNIRIRTWMSYGVVIKISKAIIATKTGCKQLIEESQKLGPIDGIFNLAVVLADASFENQTPETFVTSFEPKAFATQHLDELSRKICPSLSHFVVFSSVSCGRGNAGQTNYGMANSVMERICEKRKQDGFPALAIEWGAIGEVGLVAEMQEVHAELEISGTLQQRISNCLQVLDTLLKQNTPIVSSMVVAEKRGAVEVGNIISSVLNILGLNDLKSVSFQSTFPELGMDSITAVEIKQTLERECDIYLAPKDIRTMTLARLKKMHEEKCEGNQPSKESNSFGMEMIFRFIGNESESCLPYIQLKSNVDEKTAAPKVFLFPGIEGFAKTFQTFATHLNAHAICMQFCINTEETIRDMAESLMPHLQEHLTKNKQFNIVGYSYGTLIALEVVDILESQGYVGNIICIDGAPILMKELLRNVDVESKQIFETTLVCQLLSFYVPFEIILKHKEKIFKCSSWEDRLDAGVNVLKQCGLEATDYQKKAANALYRRINILRVYRPSFSKLKSRVKLFKPKQVSIRDVAEDYGLSNFFENSVEVQVFEGHHVTILENEKLIKTIDSFINGIGSTQEFVIQDT